MVIVHPLDWYVVESLAGLRSRGAEPIYRSAPAATDCHWSGLIAWASGSSVNRETCRQVMEPLGCHRSYSAPCGTPGGSMEGPLALACTGGPLQ